jgi:hypothetical protein
MAEAAASAAAAAGAAEAAGGVTGAGVVTIGTATDAEQGATGAAACAAAAVGAVAARRRVLVASSPAFGMCGGAVKGWRALAALTAVLRAERCTTRPKTAAERVAVVLAAGAMLEGATTFLPTKWTGTGSRPVLKLLTESIGIKVTNQCQNLVSIELGGGAEAETVRQTGSGCHRARRLSHQTLCSASPNPLRLHLGGQRQRMQKRRNLLD